jgi:glycosyltransferase involved in cell wall biosynthesis
VIRLLTFSTLYPNAVRPGNGVFVENRLRHLVEMGGVTAEVIAPVPWFPFTSHRFGAYGDFARVPPREVRHEIDVEHPRYPVIPTIGMNVAPWLLFQAMKKHLRAKLERGADFDLIDAHYFYPDGVAATLLGRHFNKPVVITARGTDINLIPDYATPRRMILSAANRAAGLVTVCQALKDRMVDLGVQGERIQVLRNGVDLNTFRRPKDRAALRAKLNLDSRTVISVGHLIPRKGHDLVIRSLSHLPDVHLLIAGEGPEEQALRSLAQKIGVASRVRFLGPVEHEQLSDFYGAADLLVLASSREGWANVLLESMACGTPVAVSNVWGAPEVVGAHEAGVLIEERTPEAIARGIEQILHEPPDRAAVRAYAEKFSWDDTSKGQMTLFRRILNR